MQGVIFPTVFVFSLCLFLRLAEGAYFEMKEGRGSDTFVFELRDEAKIKLARDIVAGKEKTQTHVAGRIIKRKVPYNPKWSFHFDPDTIHFFDMAIEVCDASLPYVEEHLDEAGGPFLPGNHWCPWSSIVVKEIIPN